MPLATVPDVTTEMPQVVAFDPRSAAEVRDAHERVKSLVRQGFRVTRRLKGKVRLDPPPRGDNINVFRVMSQNGDDRIVWDRTKPDEVRDAFNKFRELLAAGYTAYATADGARYKIEDFEPGLEEVVFAKFQDAMRTKRDVTLVPPTVPG